MEERSAGKSVLRRIRERLTNATARWWIATGALLGVGMLPCPECGMPMLCHLWPIVGLVLVVRVLRRRYRNASSTEDEAEPQSNVNGTH
jgi:hypothetical protein